MKNKLNVTALVVAALFYGFCGTSQAQSTTFTFDGIAGAGGYVGITTVTPPFTTGAYRMSVDSGSGAIHDRTWNASINPFIGGVCGSWGTLRVSFRRIDGQPFAATSVAIGSLMTTFPTATWTAIGYPASGGWMSINVTSPHSTKTIANFPAYFRNLTNLVFFGANGTSERPALDELVLVDAPAPTSRVVMDFNGPGGNTFGTFAVGATYSQYGYTMTNSGVNIVYFYDNNQNALLNAFEDDVVQFPGGAAAVRVTRDNGQPFAAKSLVVGGLVSGSLALTGNLVGGGTARIGIDTQAGSNTTVTLPYGFGNILSLDIASSTINPAFDDLTLDDAAPSSRVVIDFNYTTAWSTALTGPYLAYGYTMTNTAGAAGFVDNDWDGVIPGSTNNLIAFEDDVLGLFNDGATVRFTRDDGERFDAISLIVGSGYGPDPSTFSVIGNKPNGGTVTQPISAERASRTTVLLTDFTGLQSLDIIDTGGTNPSFPVIDDLTLEDHVPPGSVIIVR